MGFPATAFVNSALWARFALPLVEGQNRLQQDVGAVLDVLRSREFFGRMADSADTRDKYHPHRADTRNLLSVVSGAAGHRFGGESERGGRVRDKLFHPIVDKGRVTDHGFGEAEVSLIEFAQPISLGANLIE